MNKILASTGLAAGLSVSSFTQAQAWQCPTVK